MTCLVNRPSLITANPLCIVHERMCNLSAIVTVSQSTQVSTLIKTRRQWHRDSLLTGKDTVNELGASIFFH